MPQMQIDYPGARGRRTITLPAVPRVGELVYLESPLGYFVVKRVTYYPGVDDGAVLLSCDVEKS